MQFVEPVSSDVVPDQAILDMLDPLRAELDVLLSVVIGDSTVGIPRSDECGQSSGRTCESLVGDVVTDAMRTTYGTDFAIMNSGGLRAPLTCPTTDIPGDFCNPGDEGKITAGQVLTVLPFGNSVVTLSVTGAELKEHLERGVSAMPGVSGRFAQVSGLCFTYDIAAAVGSRVTSAILQALDGTCSGAAVDLTAGTTYTLAENNFTASGGDGYPIDISSAATRELLDQVAAAYVAASTPISPAIQGRITCTDSVGPNDCPVALP
jgi:2',3'-cyclic-nucleotide 2'-phosphodiesterase (5'-nucleotidase family)